MSDQPWTEIPMGDVYGQVFALLLTGLLVAVGVFFVAMLIVIVCHCRQVTRAGHRPG
jgi:hypothetical protein